MRIVILTRQIGHYHDARYRGAQPMFDNVTVISTTGEGGFSEFLATDLGGYERVELYTNREAYEASLNSGKLQSTLSARLDSISPDVIAVAGWSTAESAIAISWAKQNKVQIVMMSESQPDDANRSPLREFVKSRLVKACSAALVGGPPHREYITRLGMEEENTFYGYNAVDNAYFHSKANQARERAQIIRRELNLPKYYILASARFIEKKNLPVLISAHGRLTCITDDALELVILGDGPERHAIETARKRHPFPNMIHLLGFQGYQDLPNYYGLAEALVHVSTVEQWGLVVNEAMAAGLPVIVSDTCGVARSIMRDGHSGILTEPDESSVENALLRFTKMSPNEREKMSKMALADISPWGPERFGSGLRAAANTAIAQNRQTPLKLIDRVILSRMTKASISDVA